MAFKLASLFVEIGADQKPLDAVLANLRKRITGIAQMRFNLPGGGLLAALGIAGAGAAMTGIVKTAIDMETRIAALGKATDLEGAALAKLKAGLVALSTSLKGVKLNDLIDIATTGAKMGIASGDLLEYAEGVAKVSTAIDDMPAGEIADSIGKLNTVFKLGVQGTKQFGSAIDKLADSGVASASGILNVSQRIAGAAVTARVSAQETTALAAALLDTGTQSEMAAGSLLDFLATLNEVGGRKTMSKTLGVDAQTFAKMVETKPMEAIQGFLGALKKMDAMSQIKILADVGLKGNIHAAEIMKLAQVSDNLGKYVGLANHEFATLDQITKSYNATAQTTAAQWAAAQNQVQVLADRIGQSLLPSINNGLSLLGDLGTGLGDVFGRLSTSAQTWGVNFSGITESVGAAFRNLGDVFERTGTMIGGVFLNAWEYLSYGGEVGKTVAKYLWESMVEAFEFIKVGASNLKDNLVTIFQEIWDYVASGFKDPIEIKLKPIMEGMDKVKLKGDGKLKLPELNLSSVDNQIAAIDKRMADREAERAARLAASGKAVAGGANANAKTPGGRAAGAAGEKVGVTDVDSYARELQEGALKGGSGFDRVTGAIEDGNKILGEMNKKMKGGGALPAAVFA